MVANDLSIDERVIVSPAAGRMFPLPPETFTVEGEWVHEGQVVAEIVAAGERIPVVSRFSGWMMGMRTVPGAPVKPGDPLFWLRGR